MLLIIAKETSHKPEMYVPYEYAPAWYGISPKTAQNGIRDLKELGLLHKRIEVIKAPLSGIGKTTRTYYSLTGDFGHEARTAQQRAARSDRASRLGEPGPVAKKTKPKRRRPRPAKK